MLFNDQGGARPPVTLAISQPAHALISGGILAAWAEPLDGQLVLAAEQHDAAWLDWEIDPSFDATTGRPHVFRAIGAAVHAPMWERGVALALAAWGRRVALLLSRHGSTIYERFSDRHRSTDARSEDEEAARGYLQRQAAQQERWARALGLDDACVDRDADLLAFADTLSLVLCGAIPPPPHIDVTGRRIALTMTPGCAGVALAPWPFASDEIVFETEARELPGTGRFADAAAMRIWLADGGRVTHRSTLRRAP